MQLNNKEFKEIFHSI